VLHLGQRRAVRLIGWQVGPAGLGGTVIVEASKDGKRWRVLGEAAGAEARAWQTLRLRVVGGEGASALGAVAEVAVRGPGGKGAGGGHGGAGKGKAKGDGQRGPADRPRPAERQRRGHRRLGDRPPAAD
jgi:hypothetical protein